MLNICRSCSFQFNTKDIVKHCPKCASTRILGHREIRSLSIAHVDCDSFYASVENRDNPRLKNKPVIVGGKKRGVVAACCYIARINGIHSAMPMFQALKACPTAVVIPPNMKKYTKIGYQIKELMLQTTPQVESVSIDEAFLDLTGTELIHNGYPANTLVKLIQRIEAEIGITASVGLSYNKFLAKIASDCQKPRGFTLVGKSDVLEFLDPLPITAIWGIGKVTSRRLTRHGISTIKQLRQMKAHDLKKKYGKAGERLYYLARGEDKRLVEPDNKTKTISKEKTFHTDLKGSEDLLFELWPLCEFISSKLKNERIAGYNITLKLKDKRFKVVTRSKTLQQPTQLAEILYQESKKILMLAINDTPYRLIGLSVKKLVDHSLSDQPNLLCNDMENMAKIESTVDFLKRKFGNTSIRKGRNILKN